MSWEFCAFRHLAAGNTGLTQLCPEDATLEVHPLLFGKVIVFDFNGESFYIPVGL